MEKDDYKDIIDLPRPVSKKHTPMPVINRAAQFAPFAALTGYESAIDATAKKALEKMDVRYSSEPDPDTILP